MPLLGTRPLVFVGSAISGLTDLRAEVSRRLEQLDLAEQWLFELHTSAAGEPAEAHYLDIARSCDLMVVVVGNRRTEGTEDEYREAFLDNPDKILPFFLGEGGPEVEEFRNLLQQPNRHLRKKVDTEEQLVEAICEAVEEAVRTGRLITAPLRRALAERLRALDQLIGLDPPRSYLPVLEAGGTAQRWAEAWPDLSPMLVEGPGGAGKTYGALAALQQLALVDRVPLRQRDERQRTALDIVMPLYLRATADAHRMPELIARAFASARFFPGEDLAARYATEGRLAVVVDGHDDLVAAQREELLQSVAEWQAAYPRCRTALLARAVAADQLSAWNSAVPAPFSEEQITEMFECEGQPVQGMIDIPPELTDLVIWPFWCAALARFGLQALSGLALLQLVIARRLSTTNDPMRADKLRAALGALALDAHPATGFSAAQALDLLGAWQSMPPASAHFAVEPAETLLEAIRHSGIVQAEDNQLVFLHPLLPRVLAAEAALGDPGQPKVRESIELNVFTAALLGEEQHGELIELLAAADVFFLARVLRLHIPKGRSQDFQADVQRYETALRSLAPLAGPSASELLAQSTVLAASGENWTALTHLSGEGPRVVSKYEDLLEAASHSEVVVWQGNPFATRLPEHLAAAEVLLRFKQSFDQLTRKEPEMSPAFPAAPNDAHELTRRLQEQARTVAAAERELRVQAGLHDSRTLPTLDGEPHLKLTCRNGGRWIEETWGHDEPTVRFEGTMAEDDHDYAARFMATDPAEAARHRLRTQVEKEIGSNLGSAAWNRPTALAGWVW